MVKVVIGCLTYRSVEYNCNPFNSPSLTVIKDPPSRLIFILSCISLSSKEFLSDVFIIKTLANIPIINRHPIILKAFLFILSLPYFFFKNKYFLLKNGRNENINS